MLSQTTVKCTVNVVFLVAFVCEIQPLLLAKQHESLISVRTFKYWNLWGMNWLGIGSIDPEEEQYFCTFLLGFARVVAMSTFLITHMHEQTHTIYIKLQASIYVKTPTYFMNKLPSLGDINTKEYKINTSSLHVHLLKINIGIYKYRNVYVIHNVVLIYYGMKFIDWPLFVLYVHMLYAYQYLISKFLVRNNQVSVPCRT